MKYVFGVLITLFVLLIGALFVFGGNDAPSDAVSKPVLQDYAKGNTRVVMTTYGRLVGEDERRAIRISISATERRVDVLGGYNETVVSTKSFANTQAAYDNLLSGLSRAGFMSEKSSTIEDPRGVCPTGKRYEYKVTSDFKDVSSLWSNSCDKTGTLAGSRKQITTLFEAQIPEYDDHVKGVKL